MSRADHHYRLDTVAEIARLPVASLAADDCALLLWCTGPHIAIGSDVEVIRAWGFKPSTIAFVWVKQNRGDGRVRTRGQGCWTTANAEICFIATKDSPLRLAFDVHQVVMAPGGEHSEKPEEVRRRIGRLFGGSYLELYGRKPVFGWTVWGMRFRASSSVRRRRRRRNRARTASRQTPSESFDFEVAGLKYTATFSRFVDSGIGNQQMTVFGDKS